MQNDTKTGKVASILKYTPRQKITQQYFDAADAVDVHNHYPFNIRADRVWKNQNLVDKIFIFILALINNGRNLVL
jgi:hypothetical protein